MSLINQVLKDLDKRSNSAESSKLLSGEVRNPKATKEKTSSTLPALVLIMVAAGGYYAWQKYYQPAPPAPVVAQAPAPVPAKLPEPPAPPTPTPQPETTANTPSPMATGTPQETPSGTLPATSDNAVPQTIPTPPAQPAVEHTASAQGAPNPAGNVLSASATGVLLSLDFLKPVKYKLFTLGSPNRIVIDLEDAGLPPELEQLPRQLTNFDSDITEIRVGRYTPTITRIVLGLKGALPDAKSAIQALDNGHHRLVVQWGAPAIPTSVAANTPPQHFLGMDKELKPLAKKNSFGPDKTTTEHANTSTKLRPSRSLPDIDSTSARLDTHPTKTSTEKPVAPIVRGSSAEPLKVMSALQRSDNLYRQAITLIQQGRVVEAKEALRQSIVEHPFNHTARQLLVGLLVEDAHQGEAINLLREGLKLSPEQSAFSMSLARLQVEASDRQGALATLQEGLPNAAENPEYHAFMAALLQREERHEDAIAHFLVALKFNPSMPNWLVGIGISLQAQGKLTDAAEAFNRAKRTGTLPPNLLQFVEQRLGQINQQSR